MLAHILSNEESIQHLVHLTHTGQFEESLQQGILILPHIYEEKQQAAVLCELLESALQLARWQEAAFYFPLFEKIVDVVKDPIFSIRLLLFKGHFHLRVHGNAKTALDHYQEGLTLAFEKKEYNRLAEFVKNIIRYRVDEVEVDKLLSMAELAYIYSEWIETPKEGLRISVTMALLECYRLAGKREQFEKMEKQLSALPFLSHFPNDLARLQVLRAKVLGDQGYYAQAFCLMDQATSYYEKREEYVLLLEQLYIQREFSMKLTPTRVATLNQKIERTKKLVKQISSHFQHSMKKEEACCEDTAIFHFHHFIEDRLANSEEFLYLLAFAEDVTYFKALIEYPSLSLALSGNRVLYVIEGNNIPVDFPACSLPGVFLAIVHPQKEKTAMQLFHEAHAKMYYLYYTHKKKWASSLDSI